MKNLIAQFSQHVEEALHTIKASSFKKPSQPIHNVLITGLGGSGIGGTIISDLASGMADVPVLVNKDYTIPAFVGENTLVIACSYSGNTEETLWATRQALSRKAILACITSGGELQAIAQKENLNTLSMTGGHPPRSMFAYSFAFLAYMLEFYGIADFNVREDLPAAVKMLDKEEGNSMKLAEELAHQLKDKVPVLYAVSGQYGIASRWRQQLNENAKMLSWEAEIPEMNHNELVGWEGGSDNFAAVFLRNASDFDRNQKRIEIIKEIIGQKTGTLAEVWSKGETALQRTLYLVHFGDWVSYYLSEINQVDIIDIKSIDRLKAELSKVPL
ncbi:MAG: bifunctional phosphoglucose/phosphomannose isomerase [Owenweeksia sp.]